MKTLSTAIACCALYGALLAGCGSAPQGGSVTTGGERVSTQGHPAPAGGGGAQPAGGPGRVGVAMRNVLFVPPTITARRGQTIRWTNRDGIAHTVTADSGASFDSGNVGPGATYEFTATKAGRIHYFCTIHGQQMSGTITVTG